MQRRAALALVAALAACQTAPDYNRSLTPGAPALIPVDDLELWPDMGAQWNERDDIAPALARSIHWTRREHARQFFPMAGITHERALRSLERFEQLLERVVALAKTHSVSIRQVRDACEAAVPTVDLSKKADWKSLSGSIAGPSTTCASAK